MLYSMSELVLTPALERVRRCTANARGLDLHFDSQSVSIEAEPDERTAQRTFGLATRVLRVDLVGVEGPAPFAEVTAVWHRAPHTRATTLSAGLALTLAGVPTYMVNEVVR
jgi:hypothetical protein